MRSAAWIAVVLLGVLGQAATAQPRRAGPGAGPAGIAPAGTAERREQIKKKIRAMRAYTLTEELALDEPTAGKLFPVLARYDDETDKLLEKRVDLQRRLRHADAIRDPRAIDRMIDQALALQHDLRDLEERRIAELRKILAPTQTAKLLVVLPALERRIQNRLRRAVAQRRDGAASKAEAGAGAEDEAEADDPEPDEVPPPRRPRRDVPTAPRGVMSNAPGNTPPCDPTRAPCH